MTALRPAPFESTTEPTEGAARKLVCNSVALDSAGSPSSQTTRNCLGPMLAPAGKGQRVVLV